MHAVSSYGQGGASTRVRIYDWLEHLGLEAVPHTYAGFPDNRPARLLKNSRLTVAAERAVRTADFTGQRVLMSREASPFGRGALEQRILRRAEHSVFDFDDAIHLNRGGIRSLMAPEDKARRSVQAADVVYAGNAHLADWAAQHHRDVRVIPSCVDPQAYRPRTSWEFASDGPVIAWLGSPSTESFLEHIVPALRRVAEQHHARIRIISGPLDNPALANLNPHVERVPWSLANFAQALSTADVAVAPLTDAPFARGKCAYKLLQYAATGLPMIGSPVGANALALERFDGITATTSAEWVDGLDALITESTTRRESRGLVGLSAVRRHYSFDAWKHEWCRGLGIDQPAPG